MIDLVADDCGHKGVSLHTHSHSSVQEGDPIGHSLWWYYRVETIELQILMIVRKLVRTDWRGYGKSQMKGF